LNERVYWNAANAIRRTGGGIAGMIMTTPAGAMIDATTNKRTFVIIPGIFTVIAPAVILGCFAIGSIVIWLSFASLLKPVCAGKRTGDGAAVPVRAS
jgi:hypothetical protein